LTLSSSFRLAVSIFTPILFALNVVVVAIGGVVNVFTVLLTVTVFLVVIFVAVVATVILLMLLLFQQSVFVGSYFLIWTSL